MPGLTLLNIDRESTSTGNPLKEIREIIIEIENFIQGLSADTQPARLVPLKMKLRRLLDNVAQFGTDGSIPVEEKQSYIMELHPDLQMLANRLQSFGGIYAVQTEICMNFLLNHLCSTAAADPKGTVIGVSNVMAQVLSNEISIIPIPEFDLEATDQKYFEEFSTLFNSMLTTAGLFAAPVLGLPDIPISALGAWADQALSQFSNINKFVKQNYDPKVFYHIDQQEKAIPFDTTTDILSFYVYENEFLAALIARADILSGLEFPGGFLEDGKSVMLQSTDEITLLLAETIQSNCREILQHMDNIDKMFQSGIIDRNERPEDHPHLMRYRTEANIWSNIGKLAKLMVQIFAEKTAEATNFNSDLLQTPIDDLPPFNSDTINGFQQHLLMILDDLYANLKEMFPSAEAESPAFIKSSDFTKFRDYIAYIIHTVAAHDLLLDNQENWIAWLLDSMKSFILGTTSQYNPINALEVGTLTLMFGIKNDLQALVDQGNMILNQVKPHLEFQSHHQLAIDILTQLSDIYKSSPSNIAQILTELVSKFLEDNQVSPNSMLYQRASLYLAMLQMLGETGVFMKKSQERYVAFDPFSWIQIAEDSEYDFPYMPLNTSLDNLNSN